MIISVVSGKGGAGKTTLALSLAQSFNAQLYDLDVDAPNSEYFLQLQEATAEPVTQILPHFSTELCNGCGICTKECRFNALYKIAGTVYLTDTLCHGCGLCEMVCPQRAISYQPEEIGKMRRAVSPVTGAQVTIGDLKIGSARSTFLIQQLIKTIDKAPLTIIDGPPGNSCAAVAAIEPADLVVLVAEPTPFGFHDMCQTEEILKKLNKRYLIIANKANSSEATAQLFKDRTHKPQRVIPLDDRYHQANLNGQVLSQIFPEIQQQLTELIGPEIKV